MTDGTAVAIAKEILRICGYPKPKPFSKSERLCSIAAYSMLSIFIVPLLTFFFASFSVNGNVGATLAMFSPWYITVIIFAVYSIGVVFSTGYCFDSIDKERLALETTENEPDMWPSFFVGMLSWIGLITMWIMHKVMSLNRSLKS